MFKKISESLIFIIVIEMLSGICDVHAQESLNVVVDDMKSTPVPVNEFDSVPLFTVDSLYNLLLDDALNLQHRVDSMDEEAFQYRQIIIVIDDTYEKIKMQQKVVRLEDEMRVLQIKADSLFMIMDEMTRPEPVVQKNTLLILDTVIEGIKVYHYNLEELERSQVQMGTMGITREDKINGVMKSDPGNHHFSIQPQSLYSPDDPFEFDFQVPEGIFYRIQLAAFSREISYDHFGGINPITTQLVDDGKIVRYFAGKFTNYSEAESAYSKVRSAGFKDAFIVGYYNGQRISVDRVREFEKIHH